MRASELSGGKYRKLDEPGLSRIAADKAYARAGLKPEDVHLVELHDATSFSEIYQLEMLRLCAEGRGGPFVESGATALGGRLPVNLSGGLVSKGHPIGATGLSMVHETCLQLRGEAGARQAKGLEHRPHRERWRRHGLRRGGVRGAHPGEERLRLPRSPSTGNPKIPATLADPYPIFARMRDEDPCHWSPRLKSWVLTRYDDVRRVCLDKERVSSDRLRPFFASMPGAEAARIGDIVRYLSLWMVFKDPPEHTRLRRLTAKVFSARAMQAMRPQVQAISDRLLAALDGRDRIDLVADYAGPLPCLVIMALLGVPREALAEVKRMSDEIALFIGSSRTSPEKYDTAEAATQEMAAFFRAHRAAPRQAARRCHLASSCT